MEKQLLPIGVFDSGVGGLTVASSIRQLMPNESIIYFGDTAHLPYGDKSEAAIQAFSIKVAHFLKEKGIKCLVIACNSASASAYHVLKEYLNYSIPVINVIEPVINYLVNHPELDPIGLIGTRRTVNSGIYPRLFKEKAPQRKGIVSFATPLLAPLVEEGLAGGDVSQSVLGHYLKATGKDYKSLVLACTHYPLLIQDIEKLIEQRVLLIDSSQVTAETLKTTLAKEGLLNSSQSTPKDQFYVSDLTENFQSQARRFFGEEVNLQLHVLD